VGVLRVCARVEVTDVAATTLRTHERLPSLVGYRIEDVDLGQVQIVQAAERELELVHEIELQLGWHAKIDTRNAGKRLRIVLADGAGEKLA
jgi:hypothetical protein